MPTSEAYGLHVRESRIPRDFPQKAVRVRKIPGIATPIGSPARFYNPATRSSDLFQKAVGILLRPYIMSQGEAGKPGARGGHPSIGREQVTGIQGQPRPAKLEE